MSGAVERRRVLASGVVQGVGFRPFVYRLALDLGLTGIVRNDGGAAFIEAQGPGPRLERFLERLARELPSPGHIEHLAVTIVPPLAGESAFVIAASSEQPRTGAALAPDGFVCADCLRELRDPADRRHRHPFITCTRCGPRYTITRALPYDRPNTTLARFPLCPDCEREYRDPLDRRYHAQPVSCPRCGPVAWLVARGADPAPPQRLDPDPAAAIDQARARLLAGDIVAVKGIGGFHLAVDARSDAAVARLRAAKRRPRKPLAVMVRDLDTARRLAVLDPELEDLLASHAAPIVLAPARAGSGLCGDLAPGLDDVGLFLPYSGLHHLLLSAELDAIVLTSGNAPSEPIATDNADALASLPADAFLLHDRDIHVACDDSVVRAGPPAADPVAHSPVLVRRSRGYVPRALDATFLPLARVLALGAELKVAVATLAQGELVLGRHLGDLDNPRAEEAFVAEIERMLGFARLTPEVVAVDLHPDLYASVHGAKAFAGARLVRVQHHHAHLCAVLVEHRHAPDATACGIMLDGLGLGDDGTLWGGEVLVGSYAASRRVAHLRPVPQPGGDRAALEPGRMATSLLADADRRTHPAFDARFAPLLASRVVAPLTSSTGRLFDGVAAILGVTAPAQDYEGEAAARLEAVADPTVEDAYPLPRAGDELDTRALVAALVDDRAPVPVRAARFHNGLADALAQAALTTGERVVALGGGSLVNRWLRARLVHGLTRGGVRVLLPRVLPPGDGGLSAGQAACAACVAGRGA